MNTKFLDKLKTQKIFPIIRSSNPEEVVEKVRALTEAGIEIIEVNVETPAVYNAIKAVSNEAIICAGGIITTIQAQTALECGAKIISSPIFQMNLVKLAKDLRVPFIAGTSTANEAYAAWKARIPVVKIFPITAMGGAEYLKNLLRPMKFLSVVPQGNVKLKEVQSYIDAGALAVGVGRDLTGCSSTKEITKRARKILEKLNKNGR